MKFIIEIFVYCCRKRKLMFFGEKIGFVYENCEVFRYKVRRMEYYLGIEIVFVSFIREEKK